MAADTSLCFDDILNGEKHFKVVFNGKIGKFPRYYSCEPDQCTCVIEFYRAETFTAVSYGESLCDEFSQLILKAMVGILIFTVWTEHFCKFTVIFTAYLLSYENSAFFENSPYFGNITASVSVYDNVKAVI